MSGSDIILNTCKGVVVVSFFMIYYFFRTIRVHGLHSTHVVGVDLLDAFTFLITVTGGIITTMLVLVLMSAMNVGVRT